MFPLGRAIRTRPASRQCLRGNRASVSFPNLPEIPILRDLHRRGRIFLRMTGGSAGNQSRKFNYALGMAPDEMSAEEIQTLLAVAGKPLADAPLSLDEYETKASESFGLLGCAESDFNVEPDLAESPSDPWFEAEQDAQVVIEIGADIARRYANRELRPGFDVNDVETRFSRSWLGSS